MHGRGPEQRVRVHSCIAACNTSAHTAALRTTFRVVHVQCSFAITARGHVHDLDVPRGVYTGAPALLLLH